MTTGEAITYSTGKLQALYGPGEAGAMTALLLEKLTGLRGAGLLSRSRGDISESQYRELNVYLQRLAEQEPIQYVLEEAWFAGLKFYVDASVLIPRPETEELVQWIIDDRRYRPSAIRVLDIGTGSGCIPLALKHKLANLVVDAIDVSDEALAVARKNAELLALVVNFMAIDFLVPQHQTALGTYDIIVSNPPYIPGRERRNMQPNVLEHEPATALFVPDEDPLIFYKAIAAFGKDHLEVGGSIYVEIFEELGQETLEVFEAAGYNAELQNDMQGKNRMIRAR